MAGVTLVPQPCEICGDEKVVAHHDDYTKPYEVRWLCRHHHGKFHHRTPGKNLPGYEEHENIRSLVAAARYGRVKASAMAPSDQVDALRETASRNGRSLAAEIRLAIHDHLMAHGYLDA